MSALLLEAVTVRYGRAVPALENVGLTVAPGEIVGLVGPNGAGKTTLLRVLAGDVTPVAGVVRIAGRPVRHRSARRQVGWALDPPVLPPELTGLEWLLYLASHRARDAGRRAACVRHVIEFAELEAFVTRRIGGYSRGMAQRLALAGAVLCGAVGVLLDETLSGVDPLVQRRVRERLAALSARGRAILVASHDLGAVERLATRVLVLGHGRLLADVRTHDLLGARVMELALDGGALAAAPSLCARFPGAARTGEGVAIPLARGLTPEQVLAACRAQRVAVAATRVRYQALDDLLAATVESRS